MAPVRYPKPGILDQIPLEDHAVIEASAGTGKTFTLEHLIVEILLATETKVGELLVVTFTEKATGELRERVRKLLAKLVALEPGQGAGQEVPDERCWLIDDDRRARLAAALAAFDSATICTIHSFCRSVLSEYAFANQRLFDEELVDQREVFHRAFVEVLREELARGERRSLLQLWLQRNGDVDELEKKLYDCAGKASRIEPVCDLPRLSRLASAVQLDDAVIAEIKAEIAASGAKPTKCVNRLVKLQEPVAAMREAVQHPDNLPAVLDAADGLRAGDKEGPYLSFVVEALGALPAKSCGAKLGKSLAELELLVPSLDSIVVTQFLPLVQERVSRGKRERGQFDFQDMLSLLRDNLEGPHGAALVEALRSRFRYALIDEFQDTDTVQWEVFRRVFFQSEGRCRLFLIGDPKQAIYAFRGADVHAYLAARDEVLAAGGARVPLTSNYRSTKALIDGYNAIFEQDAEPSFFEGPIRYDEPVVAGDGKLAALGPDGEPAVPIEVLEVASPDGTKGKDLLLPLHAARVAAEIRKLLSPGSPALRFGSRGCAGPQPIGASDIYVLTRGKGDAKIVGDALRAVGVPYAFYKQDGLFQTDEAEHVQDLLDALADLEDPAKRLRAWMTPFFGLELEELAGANELQDHPLLERLRGWKSIADERRWARLFASLLDDSGLVRRQILLEQGERALTNYGHIFELLLEEFGGGHRSISDVANGLRALRDGKRRPRREDGNMQRLETEREAVQILTMHASKGLEAAAVFLFGGLNACNDSEYVFHEHGERVLWLGKAPKHVQELSAEEERQEDQRLLYVALTRAKARLYLPYFVTYKDGARSPLKFSGPYGVVHARLAAIEAAGGMPDLFRWSDESSGVAAGVPEATGLQPLTVLEPAPELLAPDDRADELAALRARHAGYVLTSYSRMAHGAPEEGEAKDEATGDDRQNAAPAEDELPGGANSGNFLHDLLAEIPAESARAETDPEAFAERPEVRRLFDRFARQYGIDLGRYAPHARRLVHTALTASLPLGGGRTLDGVCRAGRLLREMDFLFPIPEESHPLLSRPAAQDGRPFEIRRGFVKGYVDLLFEHDGVAWFADWKSDTLARFSPEALATHVEREYRVQARLYTLAMVKLLGLRDRESYERRFGGMLYLFLRGMKPGGEGGEGIYFARPTWEQVLGWEEELLRRRDFGFGGEA